jgi:hypothetical protein
MTVGRLSGLFSEGETTLFVESRRPRTWAMAVWKTEMRREPDEEE